MSDEDLRLAGRQALETPARVVVRVAPVAEPAERASRSRPLGCSGLAVVRPPDRRRDVRDRLGLAQQPRWRRPGPRARAGGRRRGRTGSPRASSGCASLMRRVASIPLMPGIETSMITTSGCRVRSRRRRRAAPSVATVDDREVVLVRERELEGLAEGPLVIDDEDRDAAPALEPRALSPCVRCAWSPSAGAIVGPGWTESRKRAQTRRAVVPIRARSGGLRGRHDAAVRSQRQRRAHRVDRRPRSAAG